MTNDIYFELSNIVKEKLKDNEEYRIRENGNGSGSILTLMKGNKQLICTINYRAFNRYKNRAQMIDDILKRFRRKWNGYVWKGKRRAC